MGAGRDAVVIEIRPGVIDEHIAATFTRKQRAMISPPDSEPRPDGPHYPLRRQLPGLTKPRPEETR